LFNARLCGAAREKASLEATQMLMTRLSEAFLAALAGDFLRHGEDVIQKVRETRPHDYLRVIAATIPKQFETPVKPVEELTDAELTAIIRECRKT
jgi:hypothetical protein